MTSPRSPLTTTEKLNFNTIPAWVTQVVERLLMEQFQVFLVGGAVRDLLWGEEPNDWDLTTDALPEQIEQIFSKTISTGKQFGTILIMEGQNSMELTTMREDLTYSDGRHPDKVLFGDNILKDLARRDFTVNAIAYDFSSQELVDPFQGRQDIWERILRSVGDSRKRFQEDGLRMFRYYRFLATLELRGDRATEQGINPEWAKGISAERIQEEFSKLLLGKRVRIGLTGLQKSGLGEVFLPEIFLLKSKRNREYYSRNLWEHLVRTVENIQPKTELRLAALLHDIAKPKTRTEDQKGVHFYGHDEQGSVQAEQILGRLRYSRKIVNTVVALIRWHMFAIDSQTGDSAIRRFIIKVSPENIPLLLELRRADIVATDRINYQTWEMWHDLFERILSILCNEFVNNQFVLRVSGADLINHFQLQPGPLIGKIISYLKELVLDNPALNQKSFLLEAAGQYLQVKERETLEHSGE